VVFTGSATCVGTPEYRFWILAPGGKWTIVADYSSSATYTWTTTGLPPGTYQFEVDVRNHGASATYETVKNLTFALS
jgi:Y_Y_Y domain